MPRPDDHKAFLLLLAAVTILFAWVLLPFFGAVMWGTVIALLFAPVYRRLNAQNGQPPEYGGAGHARHHHRHRDRATGADRRRADAGSARPLHPHQVRRTEHRPVLPAGARRRPVVGRGPAAALRPDLVRRGAGAHLVRPSGRQPGDRHPGLQLRADDASISSSIFSSCSICCSSCCAMATNCRRASAMRCRCAPTGAARSRKSSSPSPAPPSKAACWWRWRKARSAV